MQQPSGLDKLIKDTLAKRFTFVEEHMLAMISNHHSGDFRMQLARSRHLQEEQGVGECSFMAGKGCYSVRAGLGIILGVTGLGTSIPPGLLAC